MSRRYGRNQKRRHREERENLLAQLSSLTCSRALERDRVAAMERELSIWKPRIIMENHVGGEIAATVRLHPETLRFARSRDAVLEMVGAQVVEDLARWLDGQRRF